MIVIEKTKKGGDLGTAGTLIGIHTTPQKKSSHHIGIDQRRKRNNNSITFKRVLPCQWPVLLPFDVDAPVCPL